MSGAKRTRLCGRNAETNKAALPRGTCLVFFPMRVGKTSGIERHYWNNVVDISQNEKGQTLCDTEFFFFRKKQNILAVNTTHLQAVTTRLLK